MKTSKIRDFHKQLKEENKTKRKTSIIVYFLLRFLVIICMFLQFLRGDLNNAFLCFLSLCLFLLPFFIESKFKIELPNTLEIIIFLFIFAAEILGEINNFYIYIPGWDTMLHTINGFIAAGVGFALIDLLNNNVKEIQLSPLFLAILSFCFSMTIGVLWEFYEFSSDMSLLNTDMQKDRLITEIKSVSLNDEASNRPTIIENIAYTEIFYYDGDELKSTKIENGYLDIGIIDTMKDLFVNFIGALSFSIFGYLYILNRDKYHFVKNFIPIKKENKEVA